MGLSLEVGILVDLAENDEEGLKDFEANFESVNAHLRKLGLPAHDEPRSAPGLPWSAEMIGYSGLHHVRRLGAYLATGKPLPPPSGGSDKKDPVLEAFYRDPNIHPKVGTGWFGRLFGGTKPQGPTFEHLLQHSDAEGFYVPVDFERVIVAAEDELVGGYLGSTQRLQAELRVLAREVELPDDLDPDGEEIDEAPNLTVTTGPKWKRYGIESYGIAKLLEACAQSLKHKAAIVFC